MTKRTRYGASLLALLFLLTLIPASGGAQDQPQNPPDAKAQNASHAKGKVVYVCACLKNKSCDCMTEAKSEGPCACGTKGGPPLKPVPSDSAWAKANRDALAQ